MNRFKPFVLSFKFLQRKAIIAIFLLKNGFYLFNLLLNRILAFLLYNACIIDLKIIIILFLYNNKPIHTVRTAAFRLRLLLLIDGDALAKW